MSTVVLSKKSGSVMHFIDSDYKVVGDIIVVSQYEIDEEHGGFSNTNNIRFDKDDVKSVRYE